MEPNRQQPWQEQGRPSAWQGANDRRPQRPLGAGEESGRAPRYTGRQPMGGYPLPGQRPTPTGTAAPSPWADWDCWRRRWRISPP